VTGRALGRAMFALEGVLGVAVVIETARLPVAVGVTGFALVAKPALVAFALIILLVAGDAFHRGALERRVAVAVLARDIHVLAGEREMRLAVVETRVLPVFVGMAIGAGIAQLALVLVVLAVAGDTGGRRVAQLLALGVAVAALHLGHGMSALEREIGEFVVEGLFIERRDVHVPPLVLGVADAAFLFLDASMVTLLLDGVFGHLFVAVETQPALCALLEAHVALLTVALKIGMAFNYLARHDHAFDRLGARAARQHNGQGRQPEECASRAPHRRRSQYMCTAMTCTTPLITSMNTNGTCRMCQSENRRS